MSSRLIQAAINRSRTTLLVMGVSIIAGLSARLSIPVESQPRVEVPMFIVNIYHEGISPEDAERLLVMPLETELRAVEGIDEVILVGGMTRMPAVHDAVSYTHLTLPTSDLV